MEILKIISGPILGSIIGYGTNLLAIKMLFRPYREIKIVGKRIPFTPGIIPKRKPEIAKTVGNVVGNELFTKEDILKSLMNEEVQNNLVQKILDKLDSNDKTISENLITSTDEEKYKFTKNSLIEEITTKIQNAILNINGKNIQVINVHALWNKDKIGDDRTIMQSDFILSKIRKDIPCIVVGDFNLLPNTKSIEMIDEKMINLIKEYNIKSTRPTFDDNLDKGDLVCDYIFVNDKIKVNDFKVIDTNISDHMPLILDFDI